MVNFLSHRQSIEPKSASFAKAFENWVFHELKCYNQYLNTHQSIAYWRLTTGIEVDFIIGDMDVAIEVKISQNINTDHLKGLRELKTEFPELKKSVIVCLEKQVRKTADGILILPYQEFIKRLFEGEFF